MPRYQWYRCPDCAGQFRFMHHPSDAPPPDRCPLCQAWMSEDEPPEEVFVPQAPLIGGNAYARSVDASYRAMEAQSIQRADEAADQLRDAYMAENRASPHEGNQDVLDDLQKNQIFEMRSGLKVTNMRDPSSMREGDTSVIPQTSATEAAKRLTMGPSSPGFQRIEGGRPNNFQPGIGPSHSGVDALQAATGHRGWIDGTPAVPNLQHNMRAAAMTKAGELGSYTGKK